MVIGNTKYDRILGCLYGQAIGDAMGMPSELWHKHKVEEYFGWIDKFLPGPDENIAAAGFKAGEFTDDTSQAIALMDAIIACKGNIEPLIVAEKILEWAERTNAFKKNILGPTSKAALTALQNGVNIDNIEANGITNGSAMRIAPVGCLVPSNKKQLLIESVIKACCPTHKSDIAIAGACVIAWAVSCAVDGISWNEIKDELPELADKIQHTYLSTFSPSLGRRIKLALDTVKDIEDTKFALNEIYQVVGAGMDIIESVPAAIAIIEISDTNPTLCAELAANLGGDTDTIGAKACAICGALNGIQAFKKKDISLINRVNNIDFRPYAKSLLDFRLNI